MSEDIFFNIDARCDFDEFQAFFGQFKHAAFRDVEDVFAVAGCIGTVESDLVDSFDELLGFASWRILTLPSSTAIFKPPAVKVPQK